MARFSDWTQRMGKHEAFHTNIVNKVFHALMIPCQLWGVLHLASCGLNLIGLSSFWFLFALAPVFLLCDVISGGAFVGFLFALSFIKSEAHFLWGPAIFVVANLIQTKIGHGFEPQGHDDTQINIAELKKSKNPIPILLIFYYHWVEV